MWNWWNHQSHSDPSWCQPGVFNFRILFNVCIELIRHCVKETAAELKSGQCDNYGTPISCLAYADDLVIIARSHQALQKLFDAASEAAHIVGFEFCPDKCATLSTYLSFTPDQGTQKLYYTYSSLWSRVRQACRCLKVTFHYSETSDITISADESERNGSTWHCSGLNIRFKDWRFIHRARLNSCLRMPRVTFRIRILRVDVVLFTQKLSLM